MNVLGIETSCDETAAAVVSGDGVLSDVIWSQSIHEDYGGVVPELASRGWRSWLTLPYARVRAPGRSKSATTNLLASECYPAAGRFMNHECST